MLDGEPIKGCHKCYEIERNSGKSYRQQFNEIWESNKYLQIKINQSLKGENIDNTVQYLDLRYGNLCNLACRSCYPGASSQFNKEIKNLSDTNILRFHRPIEESLNEWYETSIFEENIKSQLPYLREFYITGGEPTLIEKNYKIMQSMIDTGHSKHIILRLNTNLTNTKFDFYSLLKYFERVILIASIDGKGEMQEYLRFPSKWAQISINLEKIVQKNYDNVSVSVAPVLQKTNLEYITDLFEYIESFNKSYAKLLIKISPIILIDPPYLDFKFLPLDYKLKCWEKIDHWLSNCCEYQDNLFHQKMIAVKNRCHDQTEFISNLEDFFEFTKILDHNRKQSLALVNPGLANLVNKYVVE
jgi:organic radical activating enzyme